ncbi:MAG: DUF4845 domain-containing protein [Gammaproteobacteria bacterium]|jgi:hypothetical protein|nr:DUF4845 domain-containing protein [Gammaproteobacteria bacterium]MBT4862299.1 DUF4845 domain-containing protein [Gammaproteobacteria bacterium]MBT6550915.1 DUF4845 domain-containing protein [Gammaproteobacteria bacterium]MBT6703610.1 DUF4845 domain-containing protein [Gammaproteobacteria bacterium]
MINKHSQKGLTTIGWLAVIGIFGLLVVSGFKVLPFYLDYFKLKSVMDGVVQDETVDARSKRDLLFALNKRLMINQVLDVKKEHFTFERKNNITTMTVEYEVRKPYLADLFIGAHFTYSVEIKR